MNVRSQILRPVVKNNKFYSELIKICHELIYITIFRQINVQI